MSGTGATTPATTAPAATAPAATSDAAAPARAARPHLLSIEDLGADGIGRVLRLADGFVEVSERQIPRVPALRGRTVATVFFEDSTRTRLSFETAAKRLSADTMTFNVSTSSVNKGESLRDTVETVAAMGIDAMIVRHRSAGAPWQVSRWIDASIINAGDGWHEHPTQALLDCYTIRQTMLDQDRPAEQLFSGLRIAIVGDIKHSRVARSNVRAFSALGATVILIAPPTLLPPSLERWPVEVSHDLDAVLPTLDVVYLLRIQAERMDEALFPSLREYSAGYGMSMARATALPAHAIVMHPGPMNRGVEIAAEVASLPRSVITRQVTNGVAVRMAVLFDLLASGSTPPTTPTDAVTTAGSEATAPTDGGPDIQAAAPAPAEPGTEPAKPAPTQPAQGAASEAVYARG